ncbi:MAG TPA: DUF2442 domain-containing protein [Longimicrobium sp.]
MATNLTDEEILAQLPAARERARLAAETEPRAKTARYQKSTGRVVVELSNGCLFAFPAQLGEGLRGASAAELAKVEVLPGGSGLHWHALDVDLSVPGLVDGIFGSKRWMA